MNGNDEKMTERILKYLEGEMSGDERRAFEREMAADADLAAEVERTRAAMDRAQAWLDAEAPGADMADALPLPPLHVIETAQRREAPLRTLAYALAAVALFAAGVATGLGLGEKPIPAPQSGNTVAVAESIPLTVVSPAPAAPAPTPRPRVITEKDGRLLIETTLHGGTSGATHAVMLVDGNFKLNSEL